MTETLVAHSSLTGTALHIPGYVQEGDPGAVTVGMPWFKPTTGVFSVRGSSGWIDITDALKITGVAVDITDLADGDALVYDEVSGTFINQPLASGTVAGPTSSVTHTIGRFLGTDGTTIEDSLLVLADNGTLYFTGGNARGANSVDLQSSRALMDNTQVASGVFATISGGEQNTASGLHAVVGGGATHVASGAESTVSGGSTNSATADYSTVGGGATNLASGVGSVVSGGEDNTASGSAAAILGGSQHVASGTSSTIGGGYDHTASGSQSTVGGGNANTASGDLSIIGGGYANTSSGNTSTISGGRQNAASGMFATIPGGQQAIADVPGQLAYSSGCRASYGDAQASQFVMRGQTTTNTSVNLKSSGSDVVMRAGMVYVVDVLVAARCSVGTGAGDGLGFTGQVAIKRSETGPSYTVAFCGSAATELPLTQTYYNDVSLYPGVTAVILLTSTGFTIKVTGLTSKTINWVANIRTAEVS